MDYWEQPESKGVDDHGHRWEAQRGIRGSDGIEVRWITPEGFDAGVDESTQGEASSQVGVPRDYKLLVPREWFRINLMQDRWRVRLKTFVGRQAESRNVPAEFAQNERATMRNTAKPAAHVASGLPVVDLPTGRAVHTLMLGGVGYLTLSFSARLTGMPGPIERSYDATAGSLRWVL
ncbi:hypothetical protein [Streptomyces violarus]|uniref:hypothetical protein n=1 Tax=Streptomyces violarus TaxID=67380 RepID=UPI0021C1F673|nr:hypothetical protein [Streptomyces violarus]MCT9139750.1 hypothetical protein [Streptomyces violarus]